MGSAHSLSDKYTAKTGTVFMSGTQALVRLPMVQMRRDQLNGLNTATYISGYRGSPLGSYDQQLQAAQQHLQAQSITFQPGVNEDLAATAIWGTQQVPLYNSAMKDGVLGIWYGKGPGVDRSGDVFRHANAAGSSASGGVLCLAGDDHSCKSSTVPHQSDHGFIAARIPMLFPSSVQEFVEVGLLGIALSRFCGSWVGMKVISDTIETSAVVDLGDELKEFVIPSDYQLPEGGLNLRWPDPPMVQDERVQEQREAAIHAFARANQIDQLHINASNARIGFVASGKVFEDARQAFQLLGLSETVCESLGIRLYKVRMPYPLEPQGIGDFAQGLHEIVVLEERREIIEHQIKNILFNSTESRPRVVGKQDEFGHAFLPTSATLSVAVVARAIADRLLKQFDNIESDLQYDHALKQQILTAVESLNRAMQKQQLHTAPLERRPWFCSGCPHNTSTRVPDGSRALAGIGCHYMALWMDRNTETFTHMGAEGMPWTSICEYVGDEHRFVNIGDGTYYHSGLLAIRGAVASNANITYKVLYNDAVAMTGGQSLDGNLEPAQITHQLKAEGVWPVYLITDEPESYTKSDVAAGVEILHRDHLDSVQRKVRELKGCNAIVYVQTCAAEKRRRRKRGLLEDPAQRVFINSDVCEGCGDCSTQSNCVSVEPLETAFGRKRRINQSSCNKDFSCLNGFCPSFVTVTDATIRKRKTVTQLEHDEVLNEPTLPAFSSSSWNILVTGVGGTGVLTIGSILGKAAHIDGNAAMLLDLSGLAQKGGAVISHVRLAPEPAMVTSPHILPASADVLIAADAVVGSSKDSCVLLHPERTVGVVNTSTAPVADFVLHRDLDLGNASVCESIQKQVRDADHFYAFSSIAEQLTGDAIASNILMLGYTWQQGLIPISREALQEAIKLNGVAVDANLTAFEWGRRLAANPTKVTATLSDKKEAPSVTMDELSTSDLIAHRIQHLTQYQNARLAKKFQRTIDRVQQTAHSLALGDEIVRTAAHNYARVLSYKDEYEVARLYSLPSFQQQLNAQFTGDYKIEFNLAPPLLGGKAINGRPKKRKMGRWVLSLFKVLQRGKILRGTPLDIFGYTAERKAERAWIKRYEQDLELVITQLTLENVEDALRLLALPDQLRGYGPVKMDAIERSIIQRDAILRDLLGPKPIDLTSAA